MNKENSTKNNTFLAKFIRNIAGNKDTNASFLKETNGQKSQVIDPFGEFTAVAYLFGQMKGI